MVSAESTIHRRTSQRGTENSGTDRKRDQKIAYYGEDNFPSPFAQR
jgi:hypothetical protein